MQQYMTFGDALEAAKQGKKIQRAGWNGKGMWVAFTPGSEISPADARHGSSRLLANEILAALPAGVSTASQVEARLRICPHLDMRAADGSLVVGWLASQTDMLAEDWTVLP